MDVQVPLSDLDMIQHHLNRIAPLNAHGEPQVAFATMARGDVMRIHMSVELLRRNLEALKSGPPIDPNDGQLAHKLRSPLNTLLGFAEMLLDESDEPLDAHQRDHLAEIHALALDIAQHINEAFE